MGPLGWATMASVLAEFDNSEGPVEPAQLDLFCRMRAEIGGIKEESVAADFVMAGATARCASSAVCVK